MYFSNTNSRSKCQIRHYEAGVFIIVDVLTAVISRSYLLHPMKISSLADEDIFVGR